ncbi:MULTISPECIES: lipocalin-like domain-containing protein [unclassified Pseudoalteromonas]|uniref:lipocalin-like domain-containing protein n=1 Tax=unclassified Pseudoalteromonas TaxID=194690 RepID=UPI002097D554|nr:lipocalin-like domain-containing protein [Pseudoalteromonas sp. XMcav2-N]MCO7190419.1 ABC transporter [Pseudoalteromonas sp. XMcav2-N]
MQFTGLILLIILVLTGCQPGAPEAKKNNAAMAVLGQELGVPVSAAHSLVFPRDHGAHPEQGVEWWYVTGNLSAQDGTQFGMQWTLFRVLDPGFSAFQGSPWWDGQLYFAHFALQDGRTHHAFERYGRAGQVEIQASPFIARLDNWQLASRESSFLPLRLQTRESGYGLDITLANSPQVLHGEQGYSQKTQQGHASFYYSYPFLQVTGTLTYADTHYEITGQAWLDREWSSGLIDSQHGGWDWFSLQSTEPGQGALMAFCTRDEEHAYAYCSASEISSSGEVTAYPDEQVTLTVLDRAKTHDVTHPVSWQLQLPGKEAVIIDALQSDSLNTLSVPYWEGRIHSRGGFSGQGYGELFGY